jgi:hypothetical protein
MAGGGGSQSNGGPRGRESNANGRPCSYSTSKALSSASSVNASQSKASNGQTTASNPQGNGCQHSASASRALSSVSNPNSNQSMSSNASSSQSKLSNNSGATSKRPDPYRKFDKNVQEMRSSLIAHCVIKHAEHMMTRPAGSNRCA